MSKEITDKPVATIHVDGSFVHVEWHVPVPNEAHMPVYITLPTEAEIRRDERRKALMEAVEVCLKQYPYTVFHTDMLAAKNCAEAILALAQGEGK